MPTNPAAQVPDNADPAQGNDVPLDNAAENTLHGLSWRALLLGLLLTVPNTFWITIVEVRWYTLDGTCLPLFITPIFFLFWLTLLNLGIRRLLPDRASRLTFSQSELLTVYMVLVIGTVLAGHDMFQNLFGVIGHADRYANTENKWHDLFFAFLPRFWLVRDPNALKGFYQGSVDPYDPRFWGPFVAPLCWWTLFIGTIIGMCVCLNILLRTQWSDNERLAFPIVQLPLAMTAEDAKTGKTGASLFSSRVMWSGFLAAAIVDTINGLHTLYPSTPYLEWVKLYNIGQFLTARPWNAVGATNISLYPFAIGLAFFVPLDLSFSCWFFFVMRKLFQVFGAATGMDGPGSQGFPYFEQQASGAWIAWGLTIAWALRPQFRRAWALAFGSRRRFALPEEASLARQYRGAFVGLGVGTIVLAVYSSRIGLTPWIAVLFFGLYFLLALTITRARAELGTPHEIYFVNPRLILVTLFGSQALGAQSLTAISVMYWFNRGYRCHPMPNQLESMKMGETARIKQSSILWMLLIAFVWGTLVAYWANLHVTFAEGATAKSIGFKKWVGDESYGRLQDWLNTPARVNVTQLFYIAGGFLLVLFLRGMRSNFLWWPFHPAGYALAVSFAMDYFWFCFFVAWCAKLLIVRFGGMKMHNAAVPFFLGLVLGDYVMGSLWALYGPLQHLQTYKIYI